MVTAVALFGLGAFKASFGDKAYLRSGAETLALGGVCAAVAFLVGRAVAGFAEHSLVQLYADRSVGGWLARHRVVTAWRLMRYNLRGVQRT